MIQESIYITPYDIAQDLKEFIEAQKLEKYVFVGEINNLLIGDQEALAEQRVDLHQFFLVVLDCLLVVGGHGRDH